jgi:hypothetical protein
VVPADWASSWRPIVRLSGLSSAGDPQLNRSSRTLCRKENHIMTADRTSPAVPETTSEYRPPSAVAGRAAGWIAAVILLSAFAAQAYWAAGGWAAASDFDPLLPPLPAAALAVTLTLGAATLLLTRIGALALRMPRWLLHTGPWALSAIFAAAALQSLWATTTRSGQDGLTLLDYQGPLFLLLAGLCMIVAATDHPDTSRR